MTPDTKRALEALKKESVTWYKDSFRMSDIIGPPNGMEVLFNFIDYLAATGRLPTQVPESRAEASEALDSIVTAYCMSLGMDPPAPDPGSQTARQVETIRQALTAPAVEKIEQVEELIETSERLMQWCVKNVNRGHFPEFDRLSKAIKAAQAYSRIQNQEES